MSLGAPSSPSRSHSGNPHGPEGFFLPARSLSCRWDGPRSPGQAAGRARAHGAALCPLCSALARAGQPGSSPPPAPWDWGAPSTQCSHRGLLPASPRRFLAGLPLHVEVRATTERVSSALDTRSLKVNGKPLGSLRGQSKGGSAGRPRPSVLTPGSPATFSCKTGHTHPVARRGGGGGVWAAESRGPSPVLNPLDGEAAGEPPAPHCTPDPRTAPPP